MKRNLCWLICLGLILFSFAYPFVGLTAEGYLTYDESGLSQVRCMNCGVLVAERNKHGITRKLDTWRQIKVELEVAGKPGGYMEPIVCEVCEKKHQQEGLNLTAIMEKVRWGWKRQLQYVGRNDREIREMEEETRLIKPVSLREQ